MHAGTELLGTFRFVSDSVLVTLKHIEHSHSTPRRAHPMHAFKYIPHTPPRRRAPGPASTLSLAAPHGACQHATAALSRCGRVSSVCG